MKFTLAESVTRVLFPKNIWLTGYIMLFFVLWLSTFIGTSDYNNWWIENTLTILSLLFLALTYKKYVFSDLSYLFIFIFLCLHVYGSKYTYAENPLGYWLQDIFNTERNHYDRIVHFGFGFLLTYPFQELFRHWLKLPKTISWMLPIELSISIGALYEIIEWAVADIFFKAQGHAYLGTQGDVWDAQKDIFLAFVGAILATITIRLFKKLN
jgi:putative membrane protein